MKQHFESFRDPTSTIRRAYQGAYNNRIDRFSANGGSFRVEGVTHHSLKTNCFISENIEFRRAIPEPSEIEVLANTHRICRNSYTYFNRCMYAPPDYPRGFPTTITTRCVEPFYILASTNLALDRFALNKTFDNVRWRTENSRNSFRCNVFDTVELVPWLSHKNCLEHVARNESVPVDELIWIDFNDNRELPSTPTIPDCNVLLSDKRRILFSQTRFTQVGNAGPFTQQPHLETNAHEIAAGKLFHVSTPNIVSSVDLQFNTTTKRYENTEVIQINLINDPFSGITNADTFWDDAHYYTALAAEVNLAAGPLFIRAQDLQTQRLQPDGYCYFGGMPAAVPIDATVATDRINIRNYIDLYVFQGGVYLKTNINISVPSFRIPLGATKQDFQRPVSVVANPWHGHMYHNFSQPGSLRPNLSTNALMANRPVGDLYFGNVPIYESQLEHNAGRFTRKKFARFFYDTPVAGGAWDAAANLAGNIDIVLNVEELTPWCIEFDMEDEFGRYLFYYWRAQSRLIKNNRTVTEFWRNGNAAAIHMTCLANTAFNPQGVGGITIDAGLIDTFTTFLLRTDNLMTPDQLANFDLQNVNDDVERGRLYFKKTFTGAGNLAVDTSKHDILWNATYNVAQTAFFLTEDVAVQTEGIVSVFQKYDLTHQPSYLTPAIGNYAAPLVNVRLVDQGTPNNKALFEQYNGTDNRYIDLYTWQPDPTAIRQPIIPVGFRMKLYEPFFTMGSGKNLLPCKRPFDIQGDEFPLLVQDYRVSFRRRFDRGFLKKNFFDAAEEIDDLFDWDGAEGFFASNNGEVVATLANALITNTTTQNDLQLITHSQDTAEQDDKSISAIEKYVPKLDVYASHFVPPSDNTITQQLFVDKGFPSFIFLRMEWNSREMNSAFAEMNYDTMERPRIQSVVVKLFGRENQFVSKLLEQDLYHMCRKNCHKYCDFLELWNKEHALLLSLEDLGLMGQKAGYPNKKRIEFEIRVTWKSFDTLSLMDTMEQIGRKVQLRTVFVNENHYFRGDPTQTEFYEVF